MKTCSKCNKTQPLTQFYRSKESRDGLYRHCKSCQNKMAYQWRVEHRARANELARRSQLKHRESRKANCKSWYERNRAKAIQYATSRYRAQRDEALLHYGKVCRCCGESQREFLCLDHIANNGAQHRKEIKQSRIAGWLKKNGYPAGFQVLCANCNMGKKITGSCPHGLRIIEV